MKKIINLCLLVLVVFLSGCKPAGASSDGRVTIIVNSLTEEVYRVELDFNEGDNLIDLLEQHQEIAMKGTLGGMGYYVDELYGIKASNTESTYFNIKVNDKDSDVGIQGIELHDQDIIVFTLTSYA